MDVFAHVAIVAVLVGIPLAIAGRYRKRHDGRQKAGIVFVGAALVGFLASGIALHLYDRWREQKRIENAILHLTDPLCRSTGGDEQLRALRELSCGDGRSVARFAAPDISVDRHGTLAGVLLPPSDKPYVVWFVDAGGTPLAHLALRGGAEMSYVRDPGIARATGVELTAETSVGAAPASSVIASAPFEPM